MPQLNPANPPTKIAAPDTVMLPFTLQLSIVPALNPDIAPTYARPFRPTLLFMLTLLIVRFFYRPSSLVEQPKISACGCSA